MRLSSIAVLFAIHQFLENVVKFYFYFLLFHEKLVTTQKIKTLCMNNICFQDSNDFSNIQLTPEQQRQLELIEKMPLLKETRPGEPHPGLVAGESADPDIGQLQFAL